MTYCNINGQLVEANEARISIQDRGFRYGDGVFETIAIVRGIPYQFESHVERVKNGLNAIKIPYDTSVLRGYCRQLLHKTNVTDGFLRLQITRGSGGKGYLPTDCSPTLIIEILPPNQISHKPVNLWQSSYRKISPHALPVQYKLCQGLNSTLARIEAAENQCFDALLLNESGHVCETSSGNIFWCKNNIVYTPSLACGLLEGSTRAALLRLDPDIKEIQATTETLLQADAVFICNVAWIIMPVCELLPTQIRWDSETFTTHYLQMLDADRQHYSALHHAEWQ